jgi:hypothetical protein
VISLIVKPAGAHLALAPVGGKSLLQLDFFCTLCEIGNKKGLSKRRRWGIMRASSSASEKTDNL